MTITPHEIAHTELISGLSLSSLGDRVVYCVGPAFHAKDAHKTQALWLADVGVEESARKITSGSFNDQNPKFHPTSGDVFFLSDRHKAGNEAQVFRLSAKEYGGEPEAVTSTDNVRGVSTFEISPDGRWLAYVSADEPEDKDEEDKESYVIVWRGPKKLGRLRLIDLSGHWHSGKEPRVVVSVDAHVESFTWSPDSRQILYRLADRPDIESGGFPVSEHVISVDEDDGRLQFNSTHILTHNPVLSGKSVWPQKPGKFYFLRNEDYASATTLWASEVASNASAVKIGGYGITDDAARIVAIGSTVAVEVACGLETRIDILDTGNSDSSTAFETSEDAFSSWDIREVNGKYIFVAARSSGVTGTPENVWSGSTAVGTKGVLSTKLSSHHKWMSDKLPLCVPFYWSIEDGTALQGVAAYPRGHSLKNLPTVVVPHGGPYSRDTINTRIAANYRQYLASNGFLVLSPNYRGSSGRGNTFARAARGGMGTLDYADVESMLEAAIKRGWVDREKVAIAGWSQGGFLSAWACTRPKSIWKTAVIGAGPTDWGSMAICSDIPAAEIDLAGSAPWHPRSAQQVPMYLKGCPMADVKNVKVPVLVIHGEKDARVPVTQAIGFMRGLAREANKSVSDSSTLLIYPREGHGFEERAHVEDQMTRVLAHIEKYLA
ncbi:peptidase-S9 domain-containing protein [Favolaschia claudopus]|uniref:Dipeptidyl-peptidase V n=1 Tax=Favolaschia claudopus TaxID=2862362 RepID=A0AAW0DRZ1_9AGAR